MAKNIINPNLIFTVMEKIIEKIHQFGTLNQQQSVLVLSRLTAIDIPKGGYFSEAGKVPNRVGFLTEGIMGVCYYDNKGNEITRCFVAHDIL